MTDDANLLTDKGALCSCGGLIEETDGMYFCPDCGHVWWVQDEGGTEAWRGMNAMRKDVERLKSDLENPQYDVAGLSTITRVDLEDYTRAEHRRKCVVQTELSDAVETIERLKDAVAERPYATMGEIQTALRVARAEQTGGAFGDWDYVVALQAKFEILRRQELPDKQEDAQ